MTGDADNADRPERRADGLDPIGDALRKTYDAENHDSLGRDLTGLMLALARVDDPRPVVPSPPPATDAVMPPADTGVAAAEAPRSWRRRLFGR